MSSRIKWKCRTCGKVHEQLPHGHYDSPDYYAGATPAERARNFELTTDTCRMKQGEIAHYFVRALILVPVHGTAESIGFGVWSSLSQKNFNRYLTLTDPASIGAEPGYFGWLSNRISLYPDTMNLKCDVKLQAGNMRPLITLEATDHPLAREQHQGISQDRALEIATWILHRKGLASS